MNDVKVAFGGFVLVLLVAVIGYIVFKAFLRC